MVVWVLISVLGAGLFHLLPFRLAENLLAARCPRDFIIRAVAILAARCPSDFIVLGDSVLIHFVCLTLVTLGEARLGEAPVEFPKAFPVDGLKEILEPSEAVLYSELRLDP
jgi:hypothetical protein